MVWFKKNKQKKEKEGMFITNEIYLILLLINKKRSLLVQEIVMGFYADKINDDDVDTFVSDEMEKYYFSIPKKTIERAGLELSEKYYEAVANFPFDETIKLEKFKKIYRLKISTK